MSYDNDQNEYPISDDRNKSDKFIPRYFRTLPNKKFLSATVDQLIQQGSAEKLNSYYGTTAARAYTPKDNYVTESNKLRNDYQFSPATISVDDLGNTNFYKDYIDYINQINNLKGTVTNHNNLNEQEYYALDPHIDFDKFSNYREYYWLAYGPQTVDIAGNSIDNVSTYTITRKDNVDNFSYVFNPNGFTSNPDLRILRGQTYVFEIDAPGMPMQIRTQRPGTDEFEYTEGVTNIFNEDGTQTLTWKVPITAPDVLYYVDENDINQSGVFKILDVEDAAEINVEEEVIGKKTYTSGNGIALSNGMKIRFAGIVYPEKYATGEWYVEGVGNKIQLIPEEELYIPTTYNEDKTVPFDSEYFDRLPFDDASGFAGIKDYIVINRASQDKSYWSRSNKWFHRSVIETSAKANNEVPIIDDSLRAKKPIIEFEANLKLSNFGTVAKNDVDLVDNITKDVFSTIEGKASYNIDGVDIVPGMRILFTADTDVLVKNKIYEVKQIRFINNNQLTLQETEDSDPITNETVLIKNGTTFQGKMLYFNGSDWLEAQYKNTVNQEPFFELFTQEGISTQTLQSVSQIGTNLLSYKRGTGVNDPELGFPISYRSIENIGDIEFNLNLLSDTIEYTELNVRKIIAGDQLLIKKYHGIDTFEYINAYTKAPYLSRQPVLKQTITYKTQTVFPIDMYENSASIDDLWVRVYVNNQITTDYDITNINGVANVVLRTPSQDKDIVLIKTHSASPKNDNGYYDLPINLSNNPDNINITGFTFGEMGDHVQTIVEEIQYIDGVFPGISNLRDQGLVAKHGKRFVQHSSPINLPNFHLNDETANIITAIEYNKREYSKFKREFLDVANTLGFDGDVKTHVDKVLEKINKNKNNSMPFYFSDMVAYGLCYSVDHSVFDTNNRFYPLNTKFDLSELSIRSVNVYHNGIQIAYNRDYMFNSEGFVVLSDQYEVAYDDIITICEYSNTDGSYIPPTPTKLGLYPAYVPEIYVDETYLEPQTVIQGHDGSIRIGYNDFRDHLLLELEMRIYNNIKVAYDENIFDINSYVGGEFRKTKFTHQQIDNAYIDDFIDWLNFVGNPDYTDNDFYTSTNPFTFNYFASTTPSDKPLLGFWRGIYKDAFDTDRPHTHPWEILGFSIKPAWWNKVYGPAPYTSDNIPMWKDLESGFVREPGKPLIVRSKYARPGLASFPPATSQGKIQNPLNSGYIKNFSNAAIKTKYKFGDMAPVEAAWRKSSDYPFALLKSMIINRPAHVFGLAFDRSRISRNFAGQLVYGDTNKRITLNSIQFPNSKDDAQRVQTAGLVNFIANLIYSSVNTSYAQYQTTLKGLQNKLGLRVGGYTNKEKFNLLLDSRTPLNAGNVFVPQENYNIHLNKSTAVEVVTYSGVIIEKTQAGYVVRGYDRFNPVFTINQAIPSSKDSVISQGGTSENFVEWGEGKTYLQGNLVRYEGRFYRARVEHVSGESFDATLYVGITEVPVVGGVSATIASNFSPHPSYVDYGTTFQTIQEIISFLAGYEHYLKKSGFIFESFNPEIETVQNWRMSMKDFLFWTTQNWQENSVITLSPAAETLKFYREDYIVDNIFNTLYSTAPLNSNGKLINPANLTYSRVQKEFILQPRNTPEGIYLAKLPLTQKEHVITIDNQTIFQDVIYNPGPGYKQERIKVLGYRSADWDGSTNVPGFIVDDPVIYEWEANTDYAIGDIIKYKEFYYVAKTYVAGTAEFDLNFWAILEDKPEAGMMPNLEYKVNQFADFYDLDTDNFDVEQQKLAQHLIGYQKRNYLQNILKDDVSQYKFYQGYIKEKGSKNALTKLFDSLASSTDSLEFYEEWAFNAGTYGAIDGIREIEFILDESKFQLSPQPIKLVNTVGKDNLDLIYRQPISDVYLSDEFYSPDTAFPIFDNIPKDIIKTAGYVHSDDVKLELANYTDLANVDATTLENNDYIWIGKNANNTWDVLKVENTNLTPTLNEDGTQTRLDFEYAHGLAVNDIFVIATEDSTEFLRTVRKIENNRVFVDRINTLEVGILPIRKFVSHRFDTLTKVAEKMDMSLAEATIWVDNVNDKWTVYKKSTNNYKEVWNFDNNETSDWLTDYDVNQRNNIAVVGVPSDRTVEVYARGTDSIAMELEGKIIEESGLATNTGFGKAVAISADSKYIAVGSPDATNIKTDLIGDWDNTTAFAGNSIVKHNDAYWRANVDTLPEVSSQNYSSFAAHPIIKDNLGDSTEPNLLLAGNYPKDNTLADHFLIRATAEEYKAVFVGSTISLTWNRYSVSHVNPLLAREPFENTVAGLDSTFLNGEHIIQAKVDAIITVQTALNSLAVGDTIETTTGKGEVVYLYPDGNGYIIYINNITGVWDPTGFITINNTIDIGNYVYVTPDSSHPELGGYWMIPTGSSVLFRDVIVDNSPGLIIKDIRQAGYAGSYDTYYSIGEDLGVKGTIVDGNDKISLVGRFDQSDDATVVNSKDVSSKWFIRLGPTAPNYTLPGTTIRLQENTFLQTQPWESLGLLGQNNQPFFNGEHIITEFVDGYLKVQIQTDAVGTHSFQEGDQIEDANTGAIYYVWYADWDAGFQTQTLFVNVVSGTTFSTGSDFGDSTRIIRKRSGVVDRDAGFLVEASVYTPTNDISKLIIFDTRNLPGNDPLYQLPLHEVFFIENYEYWIVPQTRTETGAGRPANEPLANNSDWTRTNSIPVTSSGGTLFTGQGYISVYERIEENAYILDSRFVIPLTDSNGNTFDAIGANLEFRNFDGLYMLYVNASDKVIFVKKGTEGLKTYDWEVSLDKDYRNTWNTSDNYFIGDIVTYPLNSNLYRANTNVTAGNPFNFTQWDLVTNDIDYTGYIPKPNTAGDDIKIAGGFDDFGNDYAISQDGKVLAAYVQRDDSTVNVDEEDTIAIYRYSNNSYRLNEEISIIDASVNDGEYKHSFALSDDGTQIAIGLHQEDAKGTLNNGRVKVYKYASGAWALTNTITSPQTTSGEKFGKQVKFIGNNLLISSLYGDRLIERSFTDGTYFDNGFTKFSELKTDVGILYIFENLNDNFMYAGILDDQLDISKDFKINQHHLYSKVGTTIVNYKWNGINNWFKHRESLPIVDVSKFKNPFMYDKSTNTFIDYIDIIDPVQGKIAGPAEQELRYKSSWDPAIYTNVGENDSVTVDAFKSWGPDQVGQLWWDISTAMFKNAYQGTPLYQTNTWNKQFAGSSIDVYEWVESSLSPAQWREEADTESGIADGISGTPKYSDDTYVLKKKYNSTLQSFSNLYYFWVKNKKTIPNKEERQTTAYDVAQYISDPRAFGYKYVELQSQNNYVVNNSLQSIKHRDTVINFTTWTIPNQQLNIHNQYQIISDGLYTSQPSEHLKTKWFDSLVGYDKNLKQVPDPALSPKLRYGNRSRPRQTWFVNRLEALKTVIERSNFALSKQIIIDDFDLSKLNTKDDAPSIFSQEYDYIVDNEIDLQFIGTNKFRQAILTPVLTNGRLTDVIIVDSGQGYKDLSYTSGVRKGPTIKVVGTGSAASVECTINSQGRIIGTTIVSPGSGYNDRTTLEVRGLTALVESDSTISNKWSLMQYNTITQEWDRKETQNFDTTLYWKYIDWYADGYNQFTDATYTLEYAYELESLDDAIGDIVKINKTSDNTWLLLEKVDDVESVDYSVNYNTVGRENGTIEIDKGLYDFTNTISGYDGYAFDTAIYDGVPIVETRNILETLFDNIFVDNLAIEYNKIFFASIRYILSEGQKPDWLFKTSFVKVKHNFGELEQRVNYQNDNLPNYQDYIAEVKPYKTKIREFVSSYSKLDNTKSRVTDFDLFPWYDSSTGKITPKTAVIENGKIIAKDSDTYPWKSWFDNATYYLDEIKIASGGTKYKSAPVLTVEGGGGTGATAVAYISRGTITSVDITNPGVGYTSAPRIVINGNQDEDGVPAELVAIIKNDTIRKINTTIKFDRVSGKLQYIDLDRTETFVSLAQQTDFTLKWPLDIDSLKIDITIDGEEALISEYEYANVVDKTFTDYTIYKGKVTFASGIAGDSTVVINYRIDPAMLSAGDRIHNLYKPVSGMPGYDTTIQDLSQVMDGIDYGGVEITSFDFDTDAGWDASGWYTDSWDEYDGNYEDIIIIGDGSTRRITLDTPLETGVRYNLYVNGTRIDDPNYGTPQATNTNALTASYVGDGITLEYDVSNFNIGDGDIFILRKETSDGTFLPDLTSFDTQLSGGNFAYGNAGGHDAGEIIVDGDGFVTVTSSRSTEEHVPGQVLDTVDIKVFDRTGDGQGIIVTRTHTFNADAEYAALAARQAEKASLEANVLAQDSTLDSLQTQLDTLEAEKVVLEQELVTLEATRDANDLTQSAYTSLLAQISDYTNQIAVKQSELSNLQSQKSSKDGEIASLQSQLSTIDGQISSLDTQISSLSSQLTTAQNELTSLQQQLSSLQNDLTNYLPSDPEYGQIQSQITQVQSQISSKQSQISSLQSQLNSLQSQRSSLLGQQNTLQSQLSAAQSESDSLAGQITTVNSQIITLQNDRTLVENQRDAYELAYNGYVADVSSKQNDISNKQSEIDVKQSQVDNQTTIILNVNNAIIAKQVEIDNAQAAIDALNLPFDIGATPIKAENLIVRATGGSLVTKNRIVGPEDYTIDYVNKTILFNNVLDTGTTITTMVVGTNGSRILDTGTFIGDGSTAQFLTKVQHKENLSAFVSVDGEKRSALAAEGVVPDVEIVKSTSEYAYDGTVIFEFGEAPPDGSLINYTLYDSDTQSFSEITIDEFTADGSTTNFTLSQIPYTGLPLDVNILVIDNNNVLHTGYKRKFTAQETNFYPLSTWHVPYQSQSANDIAVYINGVLKTNTLEYRWYPETSTLELFNDFYNIGDTIEIYTKNNSYELVGDEIRLVNVPTNGKVLVYQFSEHDTLGIERTTVNSIKRSTLVVGSDDWKAYAESALGIIRLGSSVLSENYVWLALNGELLSPTIDYSLREDFESLQIHRDIKDGDTIDVIHYTSPVSSRRFGYRQFKDILNRTHYKRINSLTETILDKDLSYTDLRIHVLDGSILDEPNKSANLPGIIFINGERIEYFVKEGNVLRQIRRGTLGTGVNTFVKAGTTVSNQGAVESIPYQDKTIINEFVGNGTDTDFTLPFSAQYGVDQFEVFVAGKRLRKAPLQKFNHLLDQTSPQADETLPAEFSVHGTDDNILRLLVAPETGQQIKVIRKIGTQWRQEGVSLKDSKTAISSFLRESTTKLPE